MTQFVSNAFFTVDKWEIDGTLPYEKPHVYCLVSVIDGQGIVAIDGEQWPINKGSHFIITADDYDVEFDGQLTLIVSHP